MTEEEVKKIVNKTINSLLGKQMLKYSDMIIYDTISERLRAYYRGRRDAELEITLKRLEGETYYEIIPLYYQQEMLLEEIAEQLNIDVSTVTRNKKNLCLKIFELMR